MTGNSPFFSIVIPAYNAARWIGATLESFLRQTDPDFEIIVADDGSSDATAQIAEGYRDRMDIRVLREPRSGAPARPCNAALAAARGKLVVCCDADDMATPDRLAWMRAAWEQVGRRDCLIFTDFTEVDENDAPIRYNKLGQYRALSNVAVTQLTDDMAWLTAESAFDALTHGCFIRPCTAAAPRTVFEHVRGFNEALRNGQDYDIYLRIAHHFPFLWVRRELGLYRVVTGSISSRSAIDLAPSRIAVLGRLMTLSLTPRQVRRVRSALAENYEALGYAYGRRRELLRSLRSYCLAFRYRPALGQLRGVAASFAKVAIPLRAAQ